MPREYPRFLFSNPKNTKSPGPFCVHLLPPRFICSLEYHVDGSNHVGTLTLKPLDFFDSCTDDEQDKLMDDMQKWLYSQIKSRQIKI